MEQTSTQHSGHHMRRTILLYLLRLVMLLLFVLIGIMALSMAFLGAFAVVAATLAVMAAAIPMAVDRAKSWFIRSVLLATTLITVIAFNDILIRQTQDRLDRVARRVLAVDNARTSLLDTLAIYTFGMTWMPLGGLLAGYPEVALEHICLYVPTSSGIRSWTSNFAMDAPSIKHTLLSFERSLADVSPDVAMVEMPRRRIDFRYGGADPYRVVLALNPVDIVAEAKRQGGAWSIDVKATVAVRYPERSRIMIPIPRVGGMLAIEEAMFHHLQEIGWLHPYEAVWMWRYTHPIAPQQSGFQP